jgi:hypothetical protein
MVTALPAPIARGRAGCSLSAPPSYLRRLQDIDLRKLGALRQGAHEQGRALLDGQLPPLHSAPPARGETDRQEATRQISRFQGQHARELMNEAKLANMIKLAAG